MAMTGGHVSVDSSGQATGDGLAMVLFLSLQTSRGADLQSMKNSNQSLESQMAGQVAKGLLTQSALDNVKTNNRKAEVDTVRGWAREANELGPPLVTYLQANATVSLSGVAATVGTGASVGRTPTPNNPGAPIVGPASAVSLPITGDAGATVLLLTLTCRRNDS